MQVEDGMYVGYEAHPSDVASLGVPIATFASRAAAVAACDQQDRCTGMLFVNTDQAAPWRTFGALLWEGVTGRVKATGENLNPWNSEPVAH